MSSLGDGLTPAMLSECERLGREDYENATEEMRDEAGVTLSDCIEGRIALAEIELEKQAQAVEGPTQPVDWTGIPL
jgi:hypothetical protein